MTSETTRQQGNYITKSQWVIVRLIGNNCTQYFLPDHLPDKATCCHGWISVVNCDLLKWWARYYKIFSVAEFVCETLIEACYFFIEYCRLKGRSKTITSPSHRTIVLTDSIDYRTIKFMHYHPKPNAHIQTHTNTYAIVITSIFLVLARHL